MNDKVKHEADGLEVAGKQNEYSLKEMVSELPPNREADRVHPKTWIVVAMLSASYGLSYWPVCSLSTAQSHVAILLGKPSQAIWFISVYNISITCSFMVCGSYSDLFGRRWFIIAGNIVMVIGTILSGTAKTVNTFIVGMAFSGVGGANCALAVFAVPELLPNKWRHIGVAIADISILFDVILGPSITRFALTDDTSWRWIFFANAIGNGIVGILLFMLYHPPKHPRGIPWRQCVLQLDYFGGILFTAAVVGILSGICYASFVPSTDPHVWGFLVGGFGMLVLFSIWETFAKLKQPLTPSRLFTHNRGRSLSVPFMIAALVTMWYLGINIIWGTMVSVFFARSTTDAAELSLVQGFGFMTGLIAIAFLGDKIKRWRTTMFLSCLFATLFCGLLALSTPKSRGLSTAFTFLNAASYGWAQILSITFCQFGADQTELGISGGLAGVARYGGSAIAGTVFTTILTKSISSNLYRVVDAAVAAGASETMVQKLLSALPLGEQALQAVPGATQPILQAVNGAHLECFEIGLRTTALSLIAFGAVACIACLGLEDICPKMNERIEVFLENDVNASKNKYH